MVTNGLGILCLLLLVRWVILRLWMQTKATGFNSSSKNLGYEAKLKKLHTLKRAEYLAIDSKELSMAKCCGLAHPKVQDYVLKETLKLGAAAEAQ